MISAKEAKSLLQTKNNLIDKCVDEELIKIELFVMSAAPESRMCDVELVIDNKMSDEACKIICIKLFGLGYGAEILKIRRDIEQDYIDMLVYW